jgi:excisionase family DNA binding protein
MQNDEMTLLKVPEAARLLSVHPRTVKEWIKSGKLPVVHLHDGPTGRRVSESDLLAFIESRRASQ